MSNNFDRATFERVFSDARVVDIDFSEWNNRISIWTLADHFVDWTDRCPVVVVDFNHVHEFDLRLPSYNFGTLHVGAHPQWHVDDFKISEGKTLNIQIFGPSFSPSLTIDCDYVSLREVSPHVLDEIVPGWNEPYSGLARPSIEKLYELWKKARK